MYGRVGRVSKKINKSNVRKYEKKKSYLLVAFERRPQASVLSFCWLNKPVAGQSTG